MLRTLSVFGVVYLVVAGLVLMARLLAHGPALPPHSMAVAPFTGPAGEWFTQVKPFCNALEVETALQRQPPPASGEGAGYGAACLALGGRIDRARALILSRPASERELAASIVFEIGHPVADAGDDRSAGPIMELVLEFWPANYMALYHAGMSEYALGQPELAARHLRDFLQRYQENDGWRQNALTVMARLDPVER